MVIYVLTVCLYSGFTLASYPSRLLQKLFLLLATWYEASVTQVYQSDLDPDKNSDEYHSFCEDCHILQTLQL